MCWLCCFLLEKAMKDFHADNTRVTDVLRVPVVQKLGRAIHGVNCYLVDTLVTRCIEPCTGKWYVWCKHKQKK